MECRIAGQGADTPRRDRQQVGGGRFNCLASDFEAFCTPNPRPRSRLQSTPDVAPNPRTPDSASPRAASRPIARSATTWGQLARLQAEAVRTSRGVAAPPWPATTSDAYPANSTTSRTPRLRLVEAGEVAVCVDRMEERSIRANREL